MLGITRLLGKIKLNKGSVALLVMGALLVALVPALTKADALTGTWVDGDMPVPVLGEQLTGPRPDECFPTSWEYHSYTKPNGDFDPLGRTLTKDVCAIQNGLGYFGSSIESNHTSFEWVKPNTAIAFSVVNGTSRMGIVPVPNQSMFIMMSNAPQPNFGATVYRFFDKFSEAGEFGPVQNQVIKELSFIPNTFTQQQPLKDSVGNNLSIGTRAFSNNGEWMAIEVRALGLARVNTLTKEIVLFSNIKFTYGLGFVPHVSLAISDDGNTVMLNGQRVYDLSGCQPVPFAYNSTNLLPGCRERYIHSHMGALFPRYLYMDAMRFSPDGLSITGEIFIQRPDTGIDRFAGTLSVAGYQPTQLSYLALGDSFSSGEGAFAYAAGTDEGDNKCHLSVNSYPVLTAAMLGLGSDSHNVACSGAVANDYFSVGTQLQYPTRPENAFSDLWFPGAEYQKAFVKRAQPQAITISMIGNDIGFSDKIKRCLVVTDSCFHFKEDRDSIVYEIHNKFDRLVNLYNNIKLDSSGARVYVLGYPNLFSTADSCAANVLLDPEERAMSRGLVGYLNAVIKSAAEKVGFVYIDVEHALAGHEHCDDAQVAVNGLTVGQEQLHIIGSESYHPNALGHQLMSQALLAQSENLTKPMPAPNPTKTAPYIGSFAYNEFVNGAPTGGVFIRSTYTTLSTVESIVKGIAFSFKPLANSPLKPGGAYQVWLHSDPVQIGTVSTDDEGNLIGDVSIPANVEPGFHTLHVVGPELSGNQQADLYQTIYVAESQDDLDGDGILNGDEPCLVIDPSGIDADRDGIDDACDPEITELPADTTPPVVAGAPDRQPNEAGWYNGDVTIAWTATDPEPTSGEPTQPASTLASQEGINTYTSDESCDPAGNCATGSLELSIDKTAPTITFTTSPTPTNGWNQPGVTVSFDCADDLSGIASCPEPQTLVGADGSYVVEGTSVDLAGNTNQTSTTIQLDATAPVAESVEWSGNPKLTTSVATISVPFTELGSGITTAEYYLGDTDPGLGNGADMQINGSMASVSFGTDFPTGVYKVTVRTQDVVGNWSQAVSDFLVVYNSDGIRMTGKRFSFPSLTNGDVLPGLLSDTQGDKAKFGFSVKYDEYGNIHHNSDFQFSYETGTKCKKSDQAQNCHNLEFNATSISWLTTQGLNDSTGIFQGVGQLIVDGATTTVPFRVTGLDGERLEPVSADNIAIHIYDQNDNPYFATPQYRVDAGLERGNIKIRKPLF